MTDATHDACLCGKYMSGDFVMRDGSHGAIDRAAGVLDD